jgi:DNA-binding MarR family transcriptional regulator
MAKGSEKPAPKREFLAAYLPYLINRVARVMLRGVDDKFQQRGLTVFKWRILAVLSDRGTCRFGELAELTSIEPATLYRFVGALSKEGLIRRRRSTSDARAIRIGLTERGEAVFTGTLPWASDVENQMIQGLSADDIEQLKRMLSVMYANVNDVPFTNLPSMDDDDDQTESAKSSQNDETARNEN